jgi:hypothetical protein
MFSVLQIITVVVVSVAFGQSLPHALELPGKKRLDKETYYKVQAIYYPGFTIGGSGEPVGIILTAVLLFFTPFGQASFWLTLAALIGLFAMQAVYWIFTHPVNKFWVGNESLDRFSTGFFSFGTGGIAAGRSPDWTELRDRWEYSHVARAVLAFIGFVALVTTLSY